MKKYKNNLSVNLGRNARSLSVGALALLLSSPLSAQKKIGDYIETFSNNTLGNRGPRTMQYYPDGRDFVCVNGKNRFTRALYGTHTDYRVETSDCPAFALYQSKNYRNLAFSVNGVSLDDAEWCESRYGDGRRSYAVRDKRWGSSALLTVEVVALKDAEGAVWHFCAKGFGGGSVTLQSRISQIANPKLRRNGDIGADKAGCFEAALGDTAVIVSELSFRDEAYAISTPAPVKADGHTIRLAAGNADVEEMYQASRLYYSNVSQQVSFFTPDPYLNTLGGALSMAADGVWDGETWLHGAIGWRMPLAGWRAGYLGDVMGWNERAVSHFDAYARSQVTNVPATIDSPSQDKMLNWARAEKTWGTQMYSNGYICRNPNRNDQMHHYDMNLNYVDELLWHFQYDADTAYMKKMWPVLKSHLEWEKRNFDKDDSHLYDAYCCIWASDALYYNGGEVTHSSAYNYRGNRLAAKIARMIGEDSAPYDKEADAILEAMNRHLWVDGHWAEYKDNMGLRRVHPDAALWSVYTPIDCGVGTPQQMYSVTKYVDRNIPHIPVEIQGSGVQNVIDNNNYVISTSDWMPYSWSINNVASAEIMHTALSFFEAGRSYEGMNLVRGNIFDQMYLGASPGNLGQISYYDAARGESYRDFGDNVGISARAIIQGVFGIVPQALDGECIIRPGFPLEWDSVKVNTPYLSYTYRRTGDKATFDIDQSFTRPLDIVVRINGEQGTYTDHGGDGSAHQTITVSLPSASYQDTYLDYRNSLVHQDAQQTVLSATECNVSHVTKAKETPVPMKYNASVTDIFRNEYLSPRPQSTSLEIPIQGIGEWCHPQFTVEINDSVFRSRAESGRVSLDGVTFLTPQQGQNILFASLWDNYPDSVTIPIEKAVRASEAAILLAGSTNHMQFRIANARITAEYTDGTESCIDLIPPYNYCPIEQDYFIDGMAFTQPEPRPLRVSLSAGKVSRSLGRDMDVPANEVYGRELNGGAAQILYMPLNSRKKLKALRLTCLSNDIVVGIMGVTLR